MDYFTLIAGLGVLALFFLFRSVVTWYLKQDKLVEQNTEIIRLLKKMANEPDDSLKS